jgi:hypothetical protein
MDAVPPQSSDKEKVTERGYFVNLLKICDNFLKNRGYNDRFVGSKVISASLMLTTALSLGAAVNEASSSVSNAHQGNISTNKY